MRKFKSFVSYILVIALLVSLLPFNYANVRAAGTTYSDADFSTSYGYNSSNGKYELTVRWIGIKSTSSAKVSYINNSGSNVALVTGENGNIFSSGTDVSLDLRWYTAVFDVSDMEDDYFYKLDISTYKTSDATGSVLASKGMYFITGITFGSDRVDNTVDGVFESGLTPELMLTWNVPKVWVVSGAGGSWQPVTDNYSTLNSSIASAGFSINISNKSGQLNSDSEGSIYIKYDGTSWKASVSDSVGSGQDADVTFADGKMSLDVIGGTDPHKTSKLFHRGIMPGTVYYMDIGIHFYDNNNVSVPDVYQFGQDSLVNRNKYQELNFTYTPVHFKVSRDELNNVYVTVFKINNYTNKELPDLSYSIQITKKENTDEKNWDEKATLTDQYFPSGSQYAVAIISDVNSTDPIKFRVVATSSKGDKLSSLNMPYQMSADSGKPPIPTNVSVDMDLSTLETGTVNDPTIVTPTPVLDDEGNPVKAKTTNIVLTWDKPANYNSLSDADKKSLIYHIMISTHPDNLGSTKYPLHFPEDYSDSFQDKSNYSVNYRWVSSVNAADLNDEGDKFTYTINGFDLFRYFYKNGGAVSGLDLNNPDQYPDWLVENTIYYLKMFTTKNVSFSDSDNDGTVEATFDSNVGAVEITDTPDDNRNLDGVIDLDDFRRLAGDQAEYKISQPSIITSFTTLPGNDREVPVPTGFTLDSENGISATLKFDNTNININDYKPANSTSGSIVYELWMNSGSGDTYFQIGSSNNTFTITDPEVLKQFTRPANFSPANGGYKIDVYNLKQNTIYRFKLKMKLVFDNNSTKESDFTSVVSVTTSKTDFEEPDDSTKIPMAPTDFNIATKDGKQVLSGTGVGVNWTVLEKDVNYQIVVTSYKISEDEKDEKVSEDPYYKAFYDPNTGTVAIDKKANSNDDLSNLDHNKQGTKFTYNGDQNLCQYNIEGFMHPNRIYFYSIRAIRVDNEGAKLYSKWVTIPVTTPMIEEPLELVCIQDYEAGFSWTDNSGADATADDYTVHIKKASESNYNSVNVKNFSITKDGTTYYARITGLAAGTEYNVYVTRSKTSVPLELNISDLLSETGSQNVYKFTTRDEYHNVEVRWKGIYSSDYNYDIEIRDDSTGEYTQINTADSTIIKEKAKDVVGTQYYYFYARITKMPVHLSDGTLGVSKQLKSNTKYYIKVRMSQSGSQSSNWAGPVTARTSFSQDDYDNNDGKDETEAKLVDRIDEIERKPYYQLNYVLATTNTLLLKGDRLAEELNVSPYKELKLDLTEISSSGKVDEIYIPEILGDTLKTSGGSIDIILDKAEYKLVSSVLDESSYKESSDLKDDYNNEKEMWFKLSVSRPDGGTEGLQNGITPISQVNIVDMNVLAVSKKYSDIKKDFTDKVYNSETGLVKQAKDKLSDYYTKNSGTTPDQTDYLIDSLVQDVEEQLANYVKTYVEGGYDSSSKTTRNSIIIDDKDITEFSSPIIATLFIDKTDDYAQPYGLYSDSSQWRKVEYLDKSGDKVSYEFIKAGKYFIGVSSGFTASMPKDHWAYQTIVDFNSKYNISDLFASGDFDPDASITLKEGILIMDRVFSKNSVNGESIPKKIQRLGMSSYFDSVSPVKDLSREQASAIYIASYCSKNGFSSDSVRSSGIVVFSDASNISSKFYNSAENAVALGIMSSDESGSFNPAGYVTRAEFITSMNRALQ